MKGRPRKLCRELENVMLQEYRMALYFRPKKIRERYGLGETQFSEYIRRAQMEGRL